jgi:hypothetical protein
VVDVGDDGDVAKLHERALLAADVRPGTKSAGAVRLNAKVTGMRRRRRREPLADRLCGAIHETGAEGKGGFDSTPIALPHLDFRLSGAKYAARSSGPVATGETATFGAKKAPFAGQNALFWLKMPAKTRKRGLFTLRFSSAK